MKRLALLLGLLLAFGAHSAFAQTACTGGLANCKQVTSGSAFSGTTVTANFTSATTGNSARGWACGQGPTAWTGITVGGVAATLSGTQPTGGSTLCVMFAAANIAGGSTAIVATGNVVCVNCTVFAEEWAGDATTALLDGSNGTYTLTTASGQSVPSGSFSTTNTNDTVETFIFIPQNTAPTPPAGYAIANSAGGAGPFYSAIKTGVTAGAQNPTWTAGAGVGNDTFNMAGGFKAAGGGATGKTNAMTTLGVGGS